MGVLLAAVTAISCCARAAFAAVAQQPRIVLKESGVRNQYILRLEEFSSRFESVQFDICIDRQVNAPEVTWRDNSSAHFQRIDTSQKDGKTILTVYIDRLRPIANSNSIELAELTFDQSIPSSRISVGNEMIALDGDQEKTVFQNPTLKVTGSTAGSSSSSSSSGGNRGGGGGSDSDSDDSSSDSSKTLDWNDVSSRVTESDGQKVLTIRVREGQVIGHEIFRQAAQKGIQLVLDYGDYIWTFHITKGISIPTNRMYYDFSIEKIRYKNLSAAVENTDLVQFEIAYSGQLPCEATLSYRVGSHYVGETAHLSYYNENEATLDYLESAKVASNGMIDYTFTHASKYVIASKDVWEPPAQQQQQGGTTAPSGSTGSAGGSSNVTVPPEDEVEEPDESDEPDEEVPSESEPDDLEPEQPVDAEVEEPSRGGTNWILPVVILLLIAGAVGVAVVIILRVRANREDDY